MASPGTPLLGYLGVGEGLAEPVGAWGTSALVKRGGRGGRTGGEGWVAWGIEKVWSLRLPRRHAGNSESDSPHSVSEPTNQTVQPGRRTRNHHGESVAPHASRLPTVIFAAKDPAVLACYVAIRSSSILSRS